MSEHEVDEFEDDNNDTNEEFDVPDVENCFSKNFILYKNTKMVKLKERVLFHILNFKYCMHLY
jgi:hypothetical protein